jgi:hypothetical protein
MSRLPKLAKIEVEAKKMDAARLAKTEEFITEVLEKELAKAPGEADRDALRTAYRTEVKKRASRSDEAAESLAAHEPAQRRLALPLRHHLQDEACRRR